MALAYFDVIVLAVLGLVVLGLIIVIIILYVIHKKIERNQQEIRIERITRGTGAIHTGTNRKLQTDLTAIDMEELRRKTLVHLPSYNGLEITRAEPADRWNKIHPRKWKDPWKDEFIIRNHNDNKDETNVLTKVE